MSEPADAVAAFWRRCEHAGAVPADMEVPRTVGAFGDSPEMADELAGLVVDGAKRATAGALAGYMHDGEAVPRVGDVSIVTDGRDVPRAVVRVTDVRVGPLSSVDDTFAWDEGEGDRTRAFWLAEHETFFRRYLPTIGIEFDDDLATVFERFEVIYAE